MWLFLYVSLIITCHTQAKKTKLENESCPDANGWPIGKQTSDISTPTADFCMNNTEKLTLKY